MLFKLHHIGMAVASIGNSLEALSIMGISGSSQLDSDAIQGVKAFFMGFPGIQKDIYIELVEPSHDRSPISNFLKKRGDGLHHLCFEVTDIEQAVQTLLESSFRLVSAPVDCSGYDRCFELKLSQPSRVAFLLTPNKILIELLQIGESS
jgi:methylmalonyl-CoA/ethylmalonyl-CoA epimerase